MVVGERDEIKLGSDYLPWDYSGGQLGYFYASATIDVAVANIKNPSDCQTNAPGGPYPGYAALASSEVLRDLSALSFGFVPEPGGLMFGTRQSNCNKGLLVFKQGGRYGLLDFLSIDASNALHFKYWLGDPGVTDFSQIAP
jgi:hypothetical protein